MGADPGGVFPLEAAGAGGAAGSRGDIGTAPPGAVARPSSPAVTGAHGDILAPFP